MVDPRQRVVRILLRLGDITTFSGIFKHIPPSVVAKRLGMNYRRMKGLIANPGKLDIETVYRLSQLFRVKYDEVMGFAAREMRGIVENRFHYSGKTAKIV